MDIDMWDRTVLGSVRSGQHWCIGERTHIMMRGEPSSLNGEGFPVTRRHTYGTPRGSEDPRIGRESGFTLVELMMVVAIIGII